MGADTYGTPTAMGLGIETLLSIFESHSCDQIFIKALAPNDNSKNQIYLAPNPDQLRSIPRADWNVHELTSRKPNASNKKILRANVPFNWLLPDGGIAPAPSSNLIFYPQYPEVRFSGFLKGSAVNASQWMQPQKQGRSDGRYLIWGVSPARGSFAYLAVPNSQISKALSLRADQEGFQAIGDPKSGLTANGFNKRKDVRSEIIQTVAMIYDKNPHAGSILKNGQVFPNTAPNAGGTTLESLFGIEPNGSAAPDYFGWELKGHSKNVVTMLTPEPDGGFYKEVGATKFTRRYGYPDRRGRIGRLNFGGIHKVGALNPLTSLELKLFGHEDPEEGSFNIDGYLGLIDINGNIAASWSFTKLLNHWQTKHANTVFVGFKRSGNSFHFAHEIYMGEGTSFSNLLRGFSNQAIYYDPGIKVEQREGKSRTKARSQFRVNKKNLAPLFDSFTHVDVLRP